MASDRDPARLWNLIEKALVPIFFKDPEGVYLYVNEAYERACGRAREQILGRTDADLYSEGTARSNRDNDLMAIEASRWTETTWPLEASGDEHIFRTVRVPVQESDGDVLGVVGVALDVTEDVLREQSSLERRRWVASSKLFERLFDSLTPQERRVAELLLIGMADKEIAEALFLTNDTVRHHVSHILKKLRTPNRTRAAIEMMKFRRRR